MDFFSVDEAFNLDLAGYSKEYFIKYKNQIKELIEGDKIPKPALLGL